MTLIWEPAHKLHGSVLGKHGIEIPLGERTFVVCLFGFFREFVQDTVPFCVNRNKSQNLQSRNSSAHVRRGRGREGVERSL